MRSNEETVKNLPTMQEIWVRFLGCEDPLEEEMATHSSILAWEIPWTEEPGGLQSLGSQGSDTTEWLNHHGHYVYSYHLDNEGQRRDGFRNINDTQFSRSRPANVIPQSYLILCDPMAYSPPGSSVHDILQARMLEWVAIPFSRGSSWPRDWTWVSCIAGRFFTIWATREAKSRPSSVRADMNNNS